MSTITVTAFTGEQPRLTPELLPAAGAQEAVDARLDDGALTPMREAVQVASASGTNHKTIFRHGGTWFSFPDVVHAAPGPVAQDRLYYTGDGPPKMRVDGTVYPLALPAPTNAPAATPSGGGSGDIYTRVYVYTWVTDFGEESEPSPASADVNWQAGQTVTLSGFSAVPTGRNVTKQRIYRSQTGRVGTFLYFIAERAATTANFVDNIAVDAFQEALPSLDWTPPPDGLQGLTAMPNGVMAAFSGRDLYFCEPWRPHAWPQKYVLTTDYPIVGLGAIAGSLAVLTTANPYFVTGSHPDSMRMDKLEQNRPCINGRTIVDLGFSICYASTDGLVAIDGGGNARIVSDNLFDRDEWQALSPETAIAGQIGGRYVLFYDTFDSEANVLAGAIFIDLAGTPFLIRASNRVTAAWFEVETGKLFFIKKGTDQIFELDPPVGSRQQLYWRSKIFRLPAPINYGAILIDAEGALSAADQAKRDAEVNALIAENAATLAAGPVDGEINAAPINAYAIGGDKLNPIPYIPGVTPPPGPDISVGIFADGVLVASVSRIKKPVRLPAGFLAREWEISVESRTKVSKIALGTTIADLQRAT